MKSRLFPDSLFNYTPKLNDLKFEIPKIFWGGAHRASSPRPLPPLFLGLRPRFGLHPSNLRRFAPSIRASPDSDPPTFEAWLRPCWIMIGKFRSAASWSEDSKTQPPTKIGQFHTVYSRDRKYKNYSTSLYIEWKIILCSRPVFRRK